jgi:hypothetical protein
VYQSGAVVPRATIILIGSQGRTTTSISSDEGAYTFSGLAPGKYKVQASAPNMAQEPVPIDLKPGIQTLRLELRVKATQQELKVQENPGPELSTDSSANASSLALSGKDLNIERKDLRLPRFIVIGSMLVSGWKLTETTTITGTLNGLIWGAGASRNGMSGARSLSCPSRSARRRALTPAIRSA